jgi:hypothetical protein
MKNYSFYVGPFSAYPFRWTISFQIVLGIRDILVRILTCYLLLVATCPVLHVEGLRTPPGICVVGHHRAASSQSVHAAFHLYCYLLSFFTTHHLLFSYYVVLTFFTLYHQQFSCQSHFSFLYHIWHTGTGLFILIFCNCLKLLPGSVPA